MSFQRRKFVVDTSVPPLDDDTCRSRGWRSMPETYFAWWHSERKAVRPGESGQSDIQGLLISWDTAPATEVVDTFAAPYCMYRQPEITNTKTGVSRKVIECSADELTREIRQHDKLLQMFGPDPRREQFVAMLRRQRDMKNAEIVSEMSDLFGGG